MSGRKAKRLRLSLVSFRAGPSPYSYQTANFHRPIDRHRETTRGGPLTTASGIASFDAGFHIIRRLWHLACALVFEIEGNTFGNIFDLNDLFETQ